MVILGDSIPFGGHFCPGCTAFPDLYGAALERKTGIPVEVTNLSRDDSATLETIESQLQDDENLRTRLASADIVIVSIGYNNMAPWPTDQPCHGTDADTLKGQIANILTYTTACIKETVATYESDYDRLFTELESLAPEQATLIALNVYNNTIGYPGVDQVTTPVQQQRLTQLTRVIFDSWNKMLCRNAASNTVQCLDIYHAFNGPEGAEPLGDKVSADDYTHPSQKGHSVIATLLGDVELAES